ncbi:DEKNAAC105515 [Brettanomyces naardenensis]|uniref:DEKNAAC105515 n=1 Tax=Brettanomyces naardenensis TaxID=13370 RepID=A0A448YTS7_BRENA|nr:DEKNAAC105515 [Brettanomyces naardenensis]
MYNQYYYELLVREFGTNVVTAIGSHDLPYLVEFIKPFDYWRGTQRRIISEYYALKDYNLMGPSTADQVVNCKYIKDSWKFVYGLYKNRRLFVEAQDFQVDEPQSYIQQGLLRVNRTYLVKYSKKVRLSKGAYRLNCGIILESSLGLLSTNFRVVESRTGTVLSNYFPPTNINEIVPHGTFTMLNVGAFKVDEKNGEDNMEDRLVDIEITIEETGLYMKSGFTICFLDVDVIATDEEQSNGDQLMPRWIAWTIDNEAAKPENIVNVLLKRLYDSISASFSETTRSTDSPFQILGSYKDRPMNNASNNYIHVLTSNDDNRMSDKEMEEYTRRFYFKFNDAGGLITRSFRYYTIVDRRKMEEKAARRIHSAESEKDDEPLRWKLPQIVAM